MAYSDPPDLLNFPTGRAAYSDRVSWVMAQFAELAYVTDLVPLTRELGKVGLTIVRQIVCENKDVSTHAFLAYGKQFAVLAFRGTTKDLRDIITDIKFPMVPTSAGRMHEGFYGGYASVKRQVSELLAEVKDLPLYITGHSLAGALATVAALDLDSQRIIAACYTFGSPCVGDGNLDQDLKCPVYRVVNASDVVTRVPAYIPLIFPYAHAGSLYYLTRNGKMLRSPGCFRVLAGRVWNMLIYVVLFPQIWWISYAVRTGKRKKPSIAPPPLEDHKIANYTAKLFTEAKQRIEQNPLEGPTVAGC